MQIQLQQHPFSSCTITRIWIYILTKNTQVVNALDSDPEDLEEAGVIFPWSGR